MAEPSFIDEYGDQCKEVSLGKVSDLTPSGKHRDFGREARDLISQGSYKGYFKVRDVRDIRELRNQTGQDMDWWMNLLEEAKRHGLYVRPSQDKHRTFIVAGIIVKKRCAPVARN